MALELASAVLLRTSAIDVLLCVAVTLETQPQKRHLDGRISQNGVENRNPRQKMAVEDDLGVTYCHEIIKATAVRLELTRAEPNAFRVHPLNRSGTATLINVEKNEVAI